MSFSLTVQNALPPLLCLAFLAVAGEVTGAQVFSTGGAARSDNFFVSDTADSTFGARWTAGLFSLGSQEELRAVTFRGITSDGAADQ